MVSASPCRTAFLLRTILILYIASGSLVYAQKNPPPNGIETYTKTGAARANIWQTVWHDAARKRDIPLKVYYPEGTGACPVILFSHGLGGSSEIYGYLGEQWASHGYVSIHPSHVGSDTTLLLTKGPGELLKAAVNVEEIRNRPLDLSFILDQLAARQASKHDPAQPFPLRDRLDLKQVGAAGHSFGAHTTVVIGGAQMALGNQKPLADPRVRAIIPMSPPVIGGKNFPRLLQKTYGSMTVPSLHLTGTLDDSPIGDTKAADRRVPFDFMVKSERQLVIFDKGDHMIFSGRPSLTPRPDDVQFQAQIAAVTTIFWQAYLRDDKPARDWINDPKAGLGKFLGTSAKVEVLPAKK
jgi:pimeloyl-ACP methyl ester carboxylesterase